MTVPVLAVALLVSSAVATPPPGLAAPGLLPAAAAQAVLSTASMTDGAVPPLSPLRVIAPFDPPTSTYGAGHRGVDLGGSHGDVIRSALPGTVTTAGPIGGMPVVVVSHGDLRTTYQPVEASVEVGAAVGAGEALGTMTAAGSHCPPSSCLHWGLRRGSDYLDPLSLLTTQRVRLLPLHGLPELRRGGAPG